MEWYLQHNIKYGRKKMMMPIQKWERHSISFLSPLYCFASYIFCFNKIWEVWVFIFVSMNQTNTISHTFIFISIFLPSNSKDFIHRRRKKIGLYLNFLQSKVCKHNLPWLCVCAHQIYVRKILLLLLLKQNIWPMPKELSKYSMLEMCFDIFTLYKGLETSISIVYIWCEKCICFRHRFGKTSNREPIYNINRFWHLHQQTMVYIGIYFIFTLYISLLFLDFSVTNFFIHWDTMFVWLN